MSAFATLDEDASDERREVCKSETSDSGPQRPVRGPPTKIKSIRKYVLSSPWEKMRPFRISERQLDAGCREIRPEGELDLSVADRFQERLNAAVADDVEVRICLKDCDVIDSTGIAAA